MAPVLAFIVWSFHIALLSTRVHGLSWGGNKRINRFSSSIGSSTPREQSASTTGLESSKLPAMYSMALNELQELESEPLCHRIAARLLVNNCQLLDGRDDEAILTDSGRVARDFVDSYAASLAICDLERGSFAIPSVCSKFQESTLARIAPPTKPQLHVTTTEIDNCLEGLAQSDSAWNTWVSYHHKTLRFCEAARADNEKDQNVRLHQRLVDILARLTTRLEEEMGERFRSLNHMFQEVETATANLKPQMNDLKNGFTELDKFFREQIVQRVQRSTDFINDGLEDARNLQNLLAMLVDATKTQSHDLISSHESALQEVTQRITTEVDTILSALTAAATSSTSLHREIEVSQSIAAAVALRQEKIETDMKRLEALADSLLIQQEGHQEKLVHAQQTASDLIDILDSASSSAATLQTSIYNSLGLDSWWPYIFCPLTSLVVGSYGLPPSTARNFMLISLGEIAGFGVSIAKQYGGDMHTAVTSYKKVPAKTNSTIVLNEDTLLYSGLTNDEIWRLRFTKNL